jgi:hypothetical protein
MVGPRGQDCPTVAHELSHTELGMIGHLSHTNTAFATAYGERLFANPGLPTANPEIISLKEKISQDGTQILL